MAYIFNGTFPFCSITPSETVLQASDWITKKMFPSSAYTPLSPQSDILPRVLITQLLFKNAHKETICPKSFDLGQKILLHNGTFLKHTLPPHLFTFLKHILH